MSSMWCEEVGKRMKKKVRGGGEAKALIKENFQFAYHCGAAKIVSVGSALWPGAPINVT
jgi:hypothetical protein